jgi:pyruvate dehydrogenase E2 component (dihydrolipoamide acetyltransferase)
MPFEIVMPRLGWNMETGSLGQWLKRDGERVAEGELLFTVEGDKATQEVEAVASGTLHIPVDSPAPGVEIAVGTVLGYLLRPGEAPPAVARGPAGETPALPGEAPASAARSQPVGSAGEANAGEDIFPAISPRARRVAGELGVDWTELQGSGRTGRIVERDVRRAAAEQPRAVRPAEAVSPVARRVAAELDVDVAALAARTPGKRLRRADIEGEAERARSERDQLPAAERPAPAGAILPITAVRRTIATRMAASAHTAAAVTLTTEADATELVRLRKELQADGIEPVPTYNDLFARLVAPALLEHPQVNARFEGDAIVEAATANIGLAVDTERGLLVPVLRDVQAKSLRQLAREAAALVEKARTGRITPDELHGGTFTITNLGMYEIDAFTPIINLPECAILGVGRIVPKQVVVDAVAERVAIRQMVFLSLTFDHRLVDGAPAARFLQRVKQYVEKPNLWLAG